MPDWFYRTLSRPILFRLSAQRSRDIALGFMGVLCRLPLGSAVIDFLGHLRADPRLKREHFGVTFPAPVGIGSGLDTRAVALPALARFGIGFLEIGPVTLAGNESAKPLERQASQQAIWRPEPAASLPLSEALERLQEVKRTKIPLVAHVAALASATAEQAAVEYEHLAAKLAGNADVLVLHSLAVAGSWSDEAWRQHLRGVVAAVANSQTRVLLALPADHDVTTVERYLNTAIEAGIAGVAVEGSMRAGSNGRLYGLPVLALALNQTRRLRERWPGLFILSSGGIHEPLHALEMLQAGASLVSTDTGLIFTGPGLPKRINEAVLFAERAGEEQPCDLAATERVWFWTALLGAGMFLGSLLALVVASTRVILPYDEAFVRLDKEALHAINPRLLSFLAHDRVSLAGAMVATGVLYLGLSLWGVRRGLHWAQQSVFLSSFVGFAAFFLFLLYGYLDPFHAFVTAILFQFLLLGVHSKLGPAPVPDAPQLVGDWRWRMSLWGQLLLVAHAVALMAAGCVIAGFGVTCVFVPEDLAFMQTTAEELRSANPYLLPLIAHDRATFGGNLVAVGLALLLPALWGFRPASAWLWWTMLLAVLPGYLAALLVHHAVGYTDLWHLTPAFGGFGLSLLGLALSYPYLCHHGEGGADEARGRLAALAANRVSGSERPWHRQVGAPVDHQGT